MSGDPQQEYFSDGITEDLITDLSNVSELFVLSRNTVFKHKGRPANMEEIAGELGVGYLLHGSVRKAGSKVRITAQLTEGASGGQVWADRYDRDLTDIFALQDEITKSIVAQLKVKLLPREKKAIEQAPTRNVEAYTYFLRGREYFHRGSRTYYNLAKRMFAKAIELDPAYARAYAGLADCDAFLYMDYSEDTADAVLAQQREGAGARAPSCRCPCLARAGPVHRASLCRVGSRIRSRAGAAIPISSSCTTSMAAPAMRRASSRKRHGTGSARRRSSPRTTRR